jgi:hypothetical protein
MIDILLIITNLVLIIVILFMVLPRLNVPWSYLKVEKDYSFTHKYYIFLLCKENRKSTNNKFIRLFTIKLKLK